MGNYETAMKNLPEKKDQNVKHGLYKAATRVSAIRQCNELCVLASECDHYEVCKQQPCQVVASYLETVRLDTIKEAGINSTSGNLILNQLLSTIAITLEIEKWVFKNEIIVKDKKGMVALMPLLQDSYRKYMKDVRESLKALGLPKAGKKSKGYGLSIEDYWQAGEKKEDTRDI